MSLSKRTEVLLLRHHKFKVFLFTTKGSSKQHQLLTNFTSCAFYEIYAYLKSSPEEGIITRMRTQFSGHRY